MPTISTSINDIDQNRLMRTLCCALRHEPWKFGIDLNEDGFAPLEAVVQSLRQRRSDCRDVDAKTLQLMIAQLDQERFEVRDGMVRARYGHSIPIRAIGIEAIPPDVLYHGTTKSTWSVIHQVGLQPMDRYLVHLTTCPDYAVSVGEAKGDVCMIHVRARLAHESGCQFFRANTHVWLTSQVPAVFLIQTVEISTEDIDPLYPQFSNHDIFQE